MKNIYIYPYTNVIKIEFSDDILVFKNPEASEMPKTVKELITKTGDSGSMPGTHMVEGDTWSLQVVLLPLTMHLRLQPPVLTPYPSHRYTNTQRKDI